MSIGNSSVYSSVIENRIYQLMDDPYYSLGLDVYSMELETAVINMLDNEFPDIEWKYFTAQFPDGFGGSVSLAWIENGNLHMIGWDYSYED